MPVNPEKHIRQASGIQHEIYSESDWLGESPENIWQIRTSRKSGKEPPEPPLPLNPQVSCDLLTRNGRRSTKSPTSSLPSPHHSLASNLCLFTVGLSKHVCISVQSLVITKFTKSCKPSQPYSMISKTSAQHMPRRLDFLPHGPYHIRKHRDGLQNYPERCTLLQRVSLTPVGTLRWTHFFDRAAH